jgi:hypothetical protein
VDADGVAEWWQEPAGEELDALCLLQTTRTWQEGLETIGVLLHCTCTPALGELE